MKEMIEEFKKIGLSQQKAEETVKNDSVCNNLLVLIREGSKYSSNGGLNTVGPLLYNCATKVKKQISQHLPVLARYIVEGKIGSDSRLSAALDYLLSHPSVELDVQAFEHTSGVGVVVTPEQIASCVTSVIDAKRAELVEKRHSANVGSLLADVRQRLRWADGKLVKQEMDVQILRLLGPKTDADKNQGKVKTKKPKEEATTKQEAAAATVGDAEEVVTISELMKKVSFHRPGENYKTDGYVVTENTMKHMKDHLKVTGGQIRTRFPPEPNGILHIGHAKAININFGYAAAHDGICFLRYDDTNPEKEEEKFFVGILDMVRWLGYEPHAVTHSSDYFQQLYDWAKWLIEQGLAFVCHQTSDQMRGIDPAPSPWRDRAVADNLQLFEDMKNGKLDEGVATLRLKLTLEEGKHDPVAYRIKFVSHHRTGDQWCIYPTYDYTHCLCDSIEQITHSMCTKEFQSRRSSYYWLCNAVDVYCPVQWEYGRLNVGYTVVSKRKIAKLISEKVVSDWDDPRLFTLTALRRRGFPAEAINSFCARLGLTGAQIVIEPEMLESVVRDSLNLTAPRIMVVLEPLKVRLVDLPPGAAGLLQVADFPGQVEQQRDGRHQVRFGQELYMERSDYCSSSDNQQPGFRRLTASQAVGLRHAGFLIRLQREIRSADGKLLELICTCERLEAAAAKPKAFVHWVSDPQLCEVRLYDRLFRHKNPEDPVLVPDGFLSDVNRDSLTVVSAMVDQGTRAKAYDRFQFERLGFFSVDPDSTKELLVFNRTVSLKEDSSKN